MAPTVTALRQHPGDRVLVELDGAPWRDLPVSVVVTAGLIVGVDLDRTRVRAVARARREQAAIGIAVRALGRREHTSASLGHRLRQRGVGEETARRTLERLVEQGALSDARYAEERARSLVARGYGNAYIEHDLEAAGTAAAAIAAALTTLPPERDRVAAIVERRGASAATARYLAGRGFGPDEIESLIADLADGEIR